MGLPYEVRRGIADVLADYDKMPRLGGAEPVLEAFKRLADQYNSAEFQKYLQDFATVASALARHRFPAEDVNPYLEDRVNLPNLKRVIAYWTLAENMSGFVRFGKTESMEFKIALCLLATELLRMDGLETGLDQQFLANLPKIE